MHLNPKRGKPARAKIDIGPQSRPEHMQTATRRRVFKAFQYRDFLLMWFGACTSSIGTWMQIVAQGWLIYRLSHSAFLLALAQFLGGIPIFLFSLIGGGKNAKPLPAHSIQFNLAVTVGPALAGTTLAKLGEKWCFGLNAVSFLAPVISLLMITAGFLPEKSAESMFTSLMQGFRFVWQQ